MQRLTKSGESSGGIHSPTVADLNRLELKAQEKRPRLRADGGLIELRAQERRSSSKCERRPPWGATVHTHGTEGWRAHVRARVSGHYKRGERNLLCTSDRSCQGSEDWNYQ